MSKFFKSVFLVSVLFLIIISLFPGSLLGYFFYDDFGKQPDVIKNPFGTTINHFICYFCISLLGMIVYLKEENFIKMVYGLFFLSIILEVLHFVVPNRSFQTEDLLGNIFGVIVAYSVVKIYLLFRKS